MPAAAAATAEQPSLTWDLPVVRYLDLAEAGKEGRSGCRPFHLTLCRAGPAACHGVSSGKSLSFSGPLQIRTPELGVFGGWNTVVL